MVNNVKAYAEYLEKEYEKLARLIFRIQNNNPKLFSDSDNKQIQKAKGTIQKISLTYQNEPNIIQS